MKKYLLNPYYILKNDQKRIVLCNGPSFTIDFQIAEADLNLFLHPMFAAVLAVFDGERSFTSCIDEIVDLFQVSHQEARVLVGVFIENKKKVGLLYDNEYFEFPKNVLIDNSSGKFSKRALNYRDYLIEGKLDFNTQRLFLGPTTINLLVNTLCATDCIYCYADRTKKMDCKIPFNRIRELIREAKQIGVVDFDISGTEIFLYNHWFELVSELVNNGYYPYLSTKYPIDEEVVRGLVDIGIKDLQFSIDTLIDAESKIIHRSKYGYIAKVNHSLELLEKYKINVAVNAVITKYNSSEFGIVKLLNKLNQFDNIQKVTFNPAEKSIICSDIHFNDFKNTSAELMQMDSFLNSVRNDYKFDLILAGYLDKSILTRNAKEKDEFFKNRASCTANVSQLCILSDGKVTICEELYWDDRFIIGNVNENSISEIWNSNRAIELASLSQDNFSDKSACSCCSEFYDCRHNLGVCWSNVIMAYGNSNWDFPDPECPYALTPNSSIFHD